MLQQTCQYKGTRHKQQDTKRASCALNPGPCAFYGAGIITAVFTLKTIMAGRTEKRGGGGKRVRSNSGDRKRHTVGSPSVNESLHEMVNRNAEPTGRSTRSGSDQRTFDLLVDDVPYFVRAAPFSFNGETRFSVCINDGREHIFTWDRDVKGLRAIDDDASTLPDSVEEAISQRLQSRK
jgi:hypothetical protein